MFACTGVRVMRIVLHAFVGSFTATCGPKNVFWSVGCAI